MVFLIKNIITWQKTNAMPNMTKRVYTHSTELIVWAVKGKKWIFNYKDLKKINAGSKFYERKNVKKETTFVFAKGRP